MKLIFKTSTPNRAQKTSLLHGLKTTPNILANIVFICFLCSFLNIAVARDKSDDSVGFTIPKKLITAEAPTSLVVHKDHKGSYLRIYHHDSDAWSVLKESMSVIGIPMFSMDENEHAIITDWVFWIYDDKTGHVSSKPKFSLSGAQGRERHRFVFTLEEDEQPNYTKIRISDKQREHEYEVAPDSEFIWLKWEQAESQPEAAAAFLEVVAKAFTSASHTKIVSTNSLETNQHTESIARVVDVGQTLSKPATEVQQKRVIGKKKIKVKSTESKAVLHKQCTQKDINYYLTNGYSNKQITKLCSVQFVDTPVEHEVEVPIYEDAPAPADAQTSTNNTSLAATQVNNKYASINGKKGLLIKASPNKTWDAIIKWAKDIKLPIASNNSNEYILTTNWAEYTYNDKKSSLEMREKDSVLWAFNIFGNGLQRHKFQIKLLSNNNQDSIVVIEHQGYQVQVDDAPDSSVSLLTWEDQETNDEIATALLRKLRLYIPQFVAQNEINGKKL